MPGPMKEGGGRNILDDVPGVHHHHAVDDIRDEINIVGYHHRGVRARSQGDQHLPRQWPVQRAGRLIRQHYRRLECGGGHDRGALEHAAAPRGGAAVNKFIRCLDPDVTQRGGYLMLRNVLAMTRPGLTHLRANRAEGIKGASGVLRHIADEPAAHSLQVPFPCANDLAVVENDGAVNTGIARQQTENGSHKRGFTATGLPDDGDAFSGLDREVDAAQTASAIAVGHPQIRAAQEWRVGLGIHRAIPWPCTCSAMRVVASTVTAIPAAGPSRSHGATTK